MKHWSGCPPQIPRATEWMFLSFRCTLTQMLWNAVWFFCISANLQCLSRTRSYKKLKICFVNMEQVPLSWKPRSDSSSDSFAGSLGPAWWSDFMSPLLHWLFTCIHTKHAQMCSVRDLKKHVVPNCGLYTLGYVSLSCFLIHSKQHFCIFFLQ